MAENILNVKANTDNLNEVTAFVDAFLEEHGCPMKVQMQIDIAVEEIFVNIANYAYEAEGGDAEIRIGMGKPDASEGGREVFITFIDSGIPYDPLAKPDPDITLSAEDRPIGGLGIYMVKKSMSSVSYERKEDKNILTISKIIG